MFADNPEYEQFTQKFQAKKTTDDCYTPPETYEVIKDWAIKEYGLDGSPIVRPFYPGGDYETYDYPDGCVVLDNPPFSILSRIVSFYLFRDIKFFLFAPTLTALSSGKDMDKVTRIICGTAIEYDNGAVVPTSFMTNLSPGVVARTQPELTMLIEGTTKRLRSGRVTQLPKYNYPPYIVTAAMMQKYSKYGIDYKVMTGDCVKISALDAQKPMGKTIYGGGLLLCERAAAERAAAERAAAITLDLSERERRIVAMLGRDGPEH